MGHLCFITAHNSWPQCGCTQPRPGEVIRHLYILNVHCKMTLTNNCCFKIGKHTKKSLNSESYAWTTFFVVVEKLPLNLLPNY